MEVGDYHIHKVYSPHSLEMPQVIQNENGFTVSGFIQPSGFEQYKIISIRPLKVSISGRWRIKELKAINGEGSSEVINVR